MEIDMKKILVILLAITVLLSFAACDMGGSGNDTGTQGQVNNNPSDGGENNNGGTNDNGNNGGASNNGGNQTIEGAISQVQMESEISRRLSAISTLTTLSLCGGESIKYTEDGVFFAGDYWIITSPNVSKDDFLASVEAQLTAAGFTKDYGVLGNDYTVKAGTGKIGINVWYDSDGAEITLRMTNHRDEYSQAFIDAENAKLPTIIEGIDIIDKLPENFSISFTTETYNYTVCRYEGGYFVSSESLEQTDMIFTSFDVALPDGNGGYTFYDWYDVLTESSGNVKEGTPQETPYFGSSSTPVQEQINKILEPLSIWLRMGWDYKELPVDEDRFIFGDACNDYSITENLVKVGTEAYLGRDCEKVHNEGMWADTYDIIFDLETGMVMKMVVDEYDTGNFETEVEVTEYNTNPTSLGDFVKP